MRVFSGQQRTWLAGLLVVLCLGPGSAAPARAAGEAIELAFDSPLTIELSKQDSVDLVLPPGTGYAVLEVQSHLLAIELQVPESSGTVVLRSLTEAPTTWLFEQRDAPVSVALTVRDRFALKPYVSVTLREAPKAALGALAMQTQINRLPRDPSDDELRRYAGMAQQAAAQWSQIDEEKAAIGNLLIASSLLEIANDYELSREAAVAAERAALAIDDSLAAGVAQNAIGLASIELEDFDRARLSLESARELLKPRYGGVAVNPAESNLCFLEFETREYAIAEPCYQSLIAQAAEYGNSGAVDRYENTLAGVYWNRGDTYQASQMLRRVLERPTTNERQRARRLNNLGVSLRALGKPQEALNAYQDALQLARSLGDRRQTAQVMNNMAVVYGDLGAPHQAVELLAEIYALSREREDRAAGVRARNYGAALLSTGQPNDARSILDDAISLAKRIDDTNGLIEAQRLAASAALAQKDAKAALELAQAAVSLAVKRSDSSRQKALAFAMLGNTQIETGDPKAAISSLEQALALWQDIGNPYGAVLARIALGVAHRAVGDSEAARNLALQAVTEIEQLRTEIASRDLRATYQSNLARAFELAVLCLIDAGDSIEALEMTERFRAKTLIDSLSQSAASRDASIPAALAAQRSDAIAAINRASDNQLRGRPAPPIATLLADLDVINDRIADATGVTPNGGIRVDADSETIRALHGPGEITLAYFLSPGQGFVWLIDQDGVQALTLPNGPAIQDRARALHEALSRRGDFEDLAAALGDDLLAPFAEQIRGADRVAIVADSALHYVPFDVLTVGESKAPFLEQTPITYLPSLTALALSRELPPAEGRGVAVLADPIFNADDSRISDPETTRSGANLNRLRMTRMEAEEIADQASDVDVVVHLGHAASSDRLRSQEVVTANILHIATHGFADDEIPARSGIALSMVDATGAPITGYVGLREIYNLDLDADLVVLSACDTALGQDLAGEGLLGLTRGFMNAGARRVVATLWQVQDRATAQLMGAFYAELFNGAAPAEALMAAKASLRRNPRYRHPYFWSGFTLQGDWRGWQVR